MGAQPLVRSLQPKAASSAFPIDERRIYRDWGVAPPNIRALRPVETAPGILPRPPREAPLRTAVVVIGMQAAPVTAHLLARLKTNGFEVVALESSTKLGETLQRHPKAILVVHSNPGDDKARRVLKKLDSVCRKSPVVVVTDRVDYGEFHELMNEGANYYYQVDESLDRMVHAVAVSAENRAC